VEKRGDMKIFIFFEIFIFGYSELTQLAFPATLYAEQFFKRIPASGKIRNFRINFLFKFFKLSIILFFWHVSNFFFAQSNGIRVVVKNLDFFVNCGQKKAD